MGTARYRRRVAADIACTVRLYSLDHRVPLGIGGGSPVAMRTRCCGDRSFHDPLGVVSSWALGFWLSLRTSAHTGVAIRSPECASDQVRTSKRCGFPRRFAPRNDKEVRYGAETTGSPCHCEPVRTLAWQSVPLNALPTKCALPKDADSHVASLLGMTQMYDTAQKLPAPPVIASQCAHWCGNPLSMTALPTKLPPSPGGGGEPPRAIRARCFYLR